MDDQPLVSPPVLVVVKPVPSTIYSSPVYAKDDSLLCPPKNTWKRPQPPPRPASAPPTRTVFDFNAENEHVWNAGINTYNTYRPIVPKRRVSAFGSALGTGALIRPLPLLFRPTTFWRRTRRSGVTGASYSPSFHLIRRSTFIAAGLSLDKPIADLSAFGVESRRGVVVLLPEFQLQ